MSALQSVQTPDLAVEDDAVAETQASADALKLALCRLPGGVSVVTAGEGDARSGATVTSATALSVEPPRMLVLRNKTSSTWPVVERFGHFSVNLLDAEATCQNLGVICVDSGFEIHFAGAAGLDIKATEVLGLVRTEDEAVEYIAALTQMYREQGRYLERIYKWTRRVGLDEIRNPIMNDADKRMAYYARFVESQKYAQVDPWSERVSGKDKHEFKPMAVLGQPQAAESGGTHDAGFRCHRPHR